MTSHLFPKIKNDIDFNKLLIDSDSVFYITKPRESHTIMQIIQGYLHYLNKEEKDIGAIDMTAGCGGNTIMFAHHYKTVNAYEIEPLRYKYLVNNLEVYGFTNVVCKNEDSLESLFSTEYDVYMCDQIWGQSYKTCINMHLTISGISLEELCNKIIQKATIPKLIILKLPYTYDIQFLKESVNAKHLFIHKIKNMLICVFVV